MKPLTQQQLKYLSESFKLGQRALQMGALSQAEKHFLDILKINPNVIEAQASLAFVYTANMQHARATTLLKTMLKSGINLAQTHHNLGVSLHEQQLYDEAIVHYQTAVKIEPRRVDSYINCAASYRVVKNYDAAIACLHKALDLDKKNAKAFHLMGIIYAELENYPRALDCLESATGLAPSDAVYRLCFANILERATLDYEAEYQYHLACEANPNYLDAFTLYGAYLLKSHYHDEALECFKRAEQLTPKNSDFFSRLDILQSLGETYLGMTNTDASIAKFNEMLAIDPEHLPALVSLGTAYQDAGKTEEACSVANRIIALDNKLHQGYELQSKVKKSNPDDALAKNLIRSLKHTSENNSKTNIHFALGKVFNDHKNYGEAFKHYVEGNALVNMTSKYDKKEDEDKFSNIIDIFNPSLFASRLDFGIDSNLPVLIVGMPRSGTTLTEQIISSHPKVIGAGEVAFWTGAASSLPLRIGTEMIYPQCVLEMTQNHANTISEMYETKLRKIAGLETNPAHITDKMPHNFLNLGLIALLFPNVKIIHTKRDPIDTCLSIFFQNFNAEGHPYAFDLANLGFHYQQYERIMHHWHEVLPGRIMDINYEDTISDPEFWSRKLIAHIGLEWDDACLAPHKLERSVKTASHWQVRQPIYKTSVQRWKNYEQFLDPLKLALGITN